MGRVTCISYSRDFVMVSVSCILYSRDFEINFSVLNIFKFYWQSVIQASYTFCDSSFYLFFFKWNDMKGHKFNCII